MEAGLGPGATGPPVVLAACGDVGSTSVRILSVIHVLAASLFLNSCVIKVFFLRKGKNEFSHTTPFSCK